MFILHYLPRWQFRGTWKIISINIKFETIFDSREYNVRIWSFK